MIFSVYSNYYSQISPGELSKPHSFLEGISNCTKCHKIGNTIQKDECFACHKEIKELININRGYHASNEVRNKNCINCHSEHNGIDFQLINLKASKFNHDLTGFKLNGSHQNLECKDCHKKDLIKNQKFKKKKSTYLGLEKKCINCHIDFHQGSLGNQCENCHNENKFNKVVNFNHDKARFKLTGKHQNVDCEKCHFVSMKNGKEFKNFKNIKFESCINCHQDVHEGKFGNNCEKCHSTASFNKLISLNNFNHDLTNFKLIGKHSDLKCNKCHKNNFTQKIKHENCFNCHEDYHKGEFTNKNKFIDCKSCHNENGFNQTHYTIEEHSKTLFPLTGAHLATECNSCHYKNETWQFRKNTSCQSCHYNPHKNSSEIVNKNSCEYCHNTNAWNEIKFNHNQTKFNLLGKHQKVNCTDCHKPEKVGINKNILFNQKSICTSCHEDKHNNQFSINGITNCQSCHEFNEWKATLFDHNKTKFKLDGAHSKAKCYQCHKNVTLNNKTFVLYKLGDVKCSSCHS